MEGLGVDNPNAAAEKLGIYSAYCYRWEKGIVSIRLDHLANIRCKTGYTWEELGALIDKEFGRNGDTP